MALAQVPENSNSYELKGQVIAVREAELAARIDGRLAHINFVPGQIVKQGDTLFEFDKQFRQIALNGAQAKQKVLEAQLQLADVKLKNAQTLRKRNVSSEIQLLEAQAQRDIAAANLGEAVANVEATQLQLRQTTLFAPIDGLISPATIREGAYLTLQSFTPNRLAIITQLNPIRVAAEVPFDIYQQRKKMFDSRQQASDLLDYELIMPTGEKYQYKGRLVGGTGEFNSVTQKMVIAVEFENPDFLLRPGLNVTLLSSVREQ